MGLSFITQLVLARFLGVENFGDYVYITTWMTTLTLLGKLGFDVAAIRYVAEYRAKEDWPRLMGFIQRAIQVTIILSLISMGLIGGMTQIMANYGVIEGRLSLLFWIGTPILLLSALREVQIGILRGLGQVLKAISLDMVVFPLLIVTTISGYSLLTVARIDATTGIFSYLLAIGLVVIVQRFYIRKYLPSSSAIISSIYSTKEWMGTSLAMSFTSGVQVLIHRMDVLAIGTFIGTSQAGIYSIAVRLVHLITLSLNVTNLASAHLFAPLERLGRLDRLQKIVYLTAKLTFLSTLPGILILFFWADYILQLFGKGFISGLPILQILLVGEIVNISTGPNGLLLNMTGHHKKMVWILACTAALDFGLIAVLLPYWGSIGVATATAVSVIFRNAITVILVWHHLKVNPTIFSIRAWALSRD